LLRFSSEQKSVAVQWAEYKEGEESDGANDNINCFLRREAMVRLLLGVVLIFAAIVVWAVGQSRRGQLGPVKFYWAQT